MASPPSLKSSDLKMDDKLVAFTLRVPLNSSFFFSHKQLTSVGFKWFMVSLLCYIDVSFYFIYFYFNKLIL